MCDTFHPLRLTKLARELDDGKYWRSWSEEPDGETPGEPGRRDVALLVH